MISGNKSRNINEYQKNIAKKKDVLLLQEQHFVSLQANQEMEKEVLQRRLQREDLHNLNVEAKKLEIEDIIIKRQRENQLFSEDQKNRATKRKRKEELFKLEKEKMKYEKILVLRGSLGYNDGDNNNDTSIG